MYTKIYMKSIQIMKDFELIQFFRKNPCRILKKIGNYEKFDNHCVGFRKK